MDTSDSPSAPRLGVVTVSYGSESELARFLPSVTTATRLQKLIVVADNKPDDSVRLADLTASAGATYLPVPSNPGYGGAINRAVASLPPTVEWVLVSNPDVVLEPGSVDTMLAAGEVDESIGAIGPAILNDDGTTYPSAREVPSIRNGIGHALFVNVWPNNRWSRAYLSVQDSHGSGPRDAGWLSGSCLLVRREAFERVGGFDEGYFMYFEDVDLGYRLGKAGFRNRYVPQAKVLHTGAHSTSGESDRMIDAHHESAMRFLAQKYPGPWLWPVRTSLRFGLRIRSMAAKRRAHKFARADARTQAVRSES